ncbi:MAG: PucR family transcriptional regulator ligand-binding domain-containing protein [Actinomycetota bacterium]
MSLTLDDLLADAALELTLLSPGRRPLRQITWVAPTELVDPTPFLTGGELILTTGSLLDADDRDAWDAYVGRLVRREVAGVGFGAGVVHHGTPAALVTAARAANLPLVEVPYGVPFVKVTRWIADGIVASQFSETLAASRLASKLAQLVASGATLPVLLAELGTAADAPVAVLDIAGEVVASHPADEGWSLAELASSGPQRDMHAISLRGAGAVDHVLVASTRGRAALTALLQTAAPILSVELARQLEDQGTRAAQMEMLLAAVRDWTTPTASLARLIKVAGLSADAPTVVVALRRTAGAVPALAWRMRLLAGEHALTVRQGTVAGSLLLLLQDGGPDLAEVLLAAAIDSFPSAPLVVGGPAADAEHLRMVVASSVTQLARAESPTRASTFDVGAVVAAAAARGSVAAAEEFLAPLIAYDRRHDTRLLETLRTYLRCDAKPGPTMAELHVHRNTLRYRLAKIESLIGQNLSELPALTSCWLALQLHDR